MVRKSVPFTRKPGSGVSQPESIEPIHAENVVPHPRHAVTQPPRVTVKPEKMETTGFTPLKLCGKALYGAVYGVTYGVVFSALIVSTLIPGRRLIGQAMLDAGGAARQDFAKLATQQRESNDRLPA